MNNNRNTFLGLAPEEWAFCYNVVLSNQIKLARCWDADSVGRREINRTIVTLWKQKQDVIKNCEHGE